MQKKRQIEPFRVSWESFVPDMRRGWVCGESFVPGMRRGRVCGESFVPDMRRGRVCGESFVPDMRRGRGCRESFVPEVCRAARAGRVLYPGARRGCCWANNVLLWRSARASCWAIAAPWHRSWAVRPSPPCPGVLRAGDGGFALHEALLRSVAGVSNPRVVQFPPIGGGAAVQKQRTYSNAPPGLGRGVTTSSNQAFCSAPCAANMRNTMIVLLSAWNSHE